jgi:VanZ family protein
MPFLFIVLSLLFYTHFYYSFNIKNKLLVTLIVILIFCLYGTAIEFIQRDYIENRSFDLGDIVADCIGCFIAFVYAYKKWIQKILIEK